MAGDICPRAGAGISDCPDHASDRPLEYCRADCPSGTMDAGAAYRQGFIAAQCRGPGFAAPFGARNGNDGEELADGTLGRGERSTIARCRRFHMDGRPIIRARAQPSRRAAAVCGLEPRALCAHPKREVARSSSASQRAGDRARADFVRLRRHLDCAWQWRRRPRGCGQARPAARAAG